MSRRAFEEMLKRRTSRRTAITTGTAGLIGVSLRGVPTRAYARQDATPETVPVDLTTRPSAQFGAYPFQLGVASGDPFPNSVVLWTRLAPAPKDGGGMDPVPYDVMWEVASDDAFSDVVQRGRAIADPNLAHSVHVDVTGLEPATAYHYRFVVGDEVSQTGRTKTAPVTGQPVDALRFAIASGSNYENGYFIAYRDMAARELDVVFHLGDYIYEWGSEDANVRAPEDISPYTQTEAFTLADYRNRHAQYHTDPDLRALRASAPLVATWDDHEVADNYAGVHSITNTPVEEFLRRRADAYQAYYEHMPLRPWSLPVGPHLTLYRSLAFGDLMQVTVLDTRQYRDDHPSGDGFNPRTPASLDPNATMLGTDQERWLLDTLSSSAATWNVIAQQALMAETYLPVPEGEAIGYYNDSWTGYPAARQRILQHLVDDQVANPVVLTGDIHTSWASNLLLDWESPDATPIGSEYACTSVTAGGTEPSGLQPYKDNFDFVRYFDPHHGGYMAVELTSDLWHADYYLVDNMEDRDSAVSHLATVVTERDTPGVQEA